LWRMGFSAGWAVPEGRGPTGAERWIPSTRNGRCRGTRRKSSTRVLWCGDMAGWTLFGASTPDGPCAISGQPAESIGPRLGAGFQEAAREARGRSSPARRYLVDVCPSGRRGCAAWGLPMRAALAPGIGGRWRPPAGDASLTVSFPVPSRRGTATLPHLCCQGRAREAHRPRPSVDRLSSFGPSGGKHGPQLGTGPGSARA